jgi:hypothetical protein
MYLESPREGVDDLVRADIAVNKYVAAKLRCPLSMCPH